MDEKSIIIAIKTWKKLAYILNKISIKAFNITSKTSSSKYLAWHNVWVRKLWLQLTFILCQNIEDIKKLDNFTIRSISQSNWTYP